MAPTQTTQPTQPTPTRTVHVEGTDFTVQTEPLLADEWVGLLDDEGFLHSVIAVDHVDFSEEAGTGQMDAFLATMQAAHTAPTRWMAWRVVGATQNEVLVSVSNDMRMWACLEHQVADYNAEVGEGHRLTADMLTRIGPPTLT